MIFDAFSSDQVPVHLITREAVQSYLLHLRPGGYLAFHISNRHFDFSPVFANLATEIGFTAALGLHLPNEEEARNGASGATWVVMARDPSRLRLLLAKPDWHLLPAHSDVPLWTDDYSSIIRLVHMHR